MARAVGIDLGTTNSVVAVLEGGEPTVIANAEGSRTTPSVVAFAKNGEVLVGEVAKRQAVTNVDRTIRSVKRQMGTNWNVKIDDKKFTAQQISAFILQKLKRDAESYLGETITDAVITTPAYFSDAQRQATKEAGQIAGLNVLRIINEPTSAALAYHLEKDNDATILVFDLGGGTFDVSLLEVGEGVVEVKATSGDNHLGGDDWDQRIVNWLVQDFKNGYGIDLSKDKMALQRLRESAEKAKIELSGSQETQINLPYITHSEQGPLHLDTKLTRAEFQKMTSDLLDRCKGPFEAGHQGRQHQARRHPARGAGRWLDPDARRGRRGQGADRRQGAEQGRQPGRGRRGRRCPAGRRAQGRGQGRPAAGRDPAVAGHRDQGRHLHQADRAEPPSRPSARRSSRPRTTSQPSCIEVFQGKRRSRPTTRSSACSSWPGSRPRRAACRIEVAFDIDANGIVNVSAKDLGTGKEQSCTSTTGPRSTRTHPADGGRGGEVRRGGRQAGVLGGRKGAQPRRHPRLLDGEVRPPRTPTRSRRTSRPRWSPAIADLKRAPRGHRHRRDQGGHRQGRRRSARRWGPPSTPRSQASASAGGASTAGSASEGTGRR